MILDQNRNCQHEIPYDLNSEFCLYVRCKFQRRIKNLQCLECQQHSHFDKIHFTTLKIVDTTKLSSFIYQKICEVEFQILNQATGFYKMLEQIQYASSLIKNYLFFQEIIEECLLFKSLQIILILQQKQQPNQEIAMKEYEQLVKSQTEKQKLNMNQQIDKYKISKVHFGLDTLCFLALSPNEKYLLIGTLHYIYLYDILTKFNIKIYLLTAEAKIAQFSKDSNKIIYASDKRITIYDIKTNKTQKINTINFGNTQEMHLIANSLYITQIKIRYFGSCMKSYVKLTKYNLKQKRQIYSYYLRDDVQFDQDLISYQFFRDKYIFNESTRKTQFKIDLEYYQIAKLFIINQKQMLSLWTDGKIVTWNINYEKNKLSIQKRLALNATDIFRGNPIYGYYYLIFYDRLQIIDKDNNPIYSGQLNSNINKTLKCNSKQFNSDQIFIVFQKDWVCIMQKTKMD